MASVGELLYAAYDELMAASDLTTVEGSYQRILDASGDENPLVKKLVIQFLSTFHSKFPSKSLETAQASLLLWDQPKLRKETKELMLALYSAHPETQNTFVDFFVPKLGEHPVDAIVSLTLIAMFKASAKALVEGLFAHFGEGSDELRAETLSFLASMAKADLASIAHVEPLILEELKKVLVDVSREEFLSILSLLKTFSMFSDNSNLQTIVEIIEEQAGLSEEVFVIENVESRERFSSCVALALEFFARGASNKGFLHYAATKIVPAVTAALEGKGEGNQVDEQVLGLLRAVADLSNFPTEAGDALPIVTAIFNLAQGYLPEPPLELESATPPPSLNFSFVEAFLFILQRLSPSVADFFADAARLKQFRMRLQYFAGVAQGCVEALGGGEGHARALAEAATVNISALTKDFFRNPVTRKASPLPSWSTIIHHPSVLGQKKKEPELAAGHTKKPRISFGNIYQPPSGKFSTHLGDGGVPPQPTPSPTRGGGMRGQGRSQRGGGRGQTRGHGRGRGGFRGRGRRN